MAEPNLHARYQTSTYEAEIVMCRPAFVRITKGIIDAVLDWNIEVALWFRQFSTDQAAVFRFLTSVDDGELDLISRVGGIDGSP